MNLFRIKWRRGEVLSPPAEPVAMAEPEPSDEEVLALQTANAVTSWASFDTGLYEQLVPGLRKL